MNFLLDMYDETKETKYKDALELGFDCLFDMEIEGGGWPQQNNHYSDEYQSYVTLNDGAMEDVFNVMLKAYKSPRKWWKF
jgi:PelA/Pel-15E family pectate lyase